MHLTGLFILCCMNTAHKDNTLRLQFNHSRIQLVVKAASDASVVSQGIFVFVWLC